MGLISDQTFVIFGGLGRQGNSVAQELSKRYPDIKLKLVTRGNPAEKKSDIKNATIVQADLDNYDSLLPVLQGAYGVFLVTSFWPSEADGGTGANKPLDGTVERQAALNCLKACRAAKVTHLVHSALEDTRLISEFNADKKLPVDANGYLVAHFDSKGEAQKIFCEQQDVKVDFVYLGFYYSNWFGMKPALNEDGKSYSLYLPMGDKDHYMVDVADTGKIVAPLFNRLPEFGQAKLPGGDVPSWPIHGVIAAKYTGEELAQCFSEVCLDGKPCTYVALPIEAYIASAVKMGFPEVIARDMGHMFAFFQTEAYRKLRGDAFIAGKDKGMTSFKQWLGAVKEALYPPA